MHGDVKLPYPSLLPVVKSHLCITKTLVGKLEKLFVLSIANYLQFEINQTMRSLLPVVHIIMKLLEMLIMCITMMLLKDQVTVTVERLGTNEY